MLITHLDINVARQAPPSRHIAKGPRVALLYFLAFDVGRENCPFNWEMTMMRFFVACHFLAGLVGWPTSGLFWLRADSNSCRPKCTVLDQFACNFPHTDGCDDRVILVLSAQTQQTAHLDTAQAGAAGGGGPSASSAARERGACRLQACYGPAPKLE